MLTGKRAFEGDDISITLASVLKDDVRLEGAAGGSAAVDPPSAAAMPRKGSEATPERHRRRPARTRRVRASADGPAAATVAPIARATWRHGTAVGARGADDCAALYGASCCGRRGSRRPLQTRRCASAPTSASTVRWRSTSGAAAVHLAGRKSGGVRRPDWRSQSCSTSAALDQLQLHAF